MNPIVAINMDSNTYRITMPDGTVYAVTHALWSDMLDASQLVN